MIEPLRRRVAGWGRSLLGAILFYTILPLPQAWGGEVTRVARWAPLVGIGLGAGLAALAASLAALGVPPLTASALVVLLGLGLTGGLHLDGAMDTADGLAVWDAQQRLRVMQDSRTGAFGAMAAIAIILLKVVALSEMPAGDRLWALPAAAAWGRWGQVVAIARYPYLKATGKGAFHQRSLRRPHDLLLSSATILIASAGHIYLTREKWWLAVSIHLLGCLLASGIGAYLYQRLGGQTGDTYGAIVEWTEAGLLAAIASFTATI